MKILAVQNRMGIGDTVIFLPFIKALHKKFNLAGTIRASFGIYNTKSEIDYFFDCLSKAYKMLY